MTGPTRKAHLPAFARRLAVLALAIAAVGAPTLGAPSVVAAAGAKVVIVVGPTHGSTQTYIDRANIIAAQAASYGAVVTKVYTPHATWDRVRSVAQSAKLLIYLGHGNGWPSPYAPYTGATKDGFGLNPYDGSGFGSPVKYYGEDYIAASIRLAPGAVVILNHLCYASGAGEPGSPNPTWDVARQRVDNFAAGFIAAGASGVIADGHTDISHELKIVLGAGSRNLADAWRADSDSNGHTRTFASARRSGFTNYIDPDYASSGFYRALTTKSTFVTGAGATATATTAAAALRAKTTTAVILRSSPSSTASSLSTIASGTTVTVTGALRTDGSGRTWAPVVTSTGRTGYIAAWLASFTGSAVATTNVILRSAPSATAGKITTVTAGSRVTVLGSRADGSYRDWFSVKTSSGITGWMAGWLMKP